MSKANIDIIILDEIDSTNNEAQRVLNYKSKPEKYNCHTNIEVFTISRFFIYS